VAAAIGLSAKRSVRMSMFQIIGIIVLIVLIVVFFQLRKRQQ
jgi:hypothetical protein